MTQDKTYDLTQTIAKVAEHLPTLDVAVQRFGKADALDGRDGHRMTDWLPPGRWPEIGLELIEGVEIDSIEHVVKEWNAETFASQLDDDVTFGFMKALDKRGLSANCMNIVIEKWLMVLGIRQQFTNEYAQYGLPLLKEVAVYFGLPNPIGDDRGDEEKYEG